MNNLTTEEKKAIESWTSPEQKEYRRIKGVLRGDYNGSLKSFYEKKANILLTLFEKYDDNTEKKILYRGDVLEGETNTYTDEEIYSNYIYNNPIGKCIVLSPTILSFTLSESIAKVSYKNSDKHKNERTPTILYIVKNRKSTFLDISAYSKVLGESEVLCNKGIRFIVEDIGEGENNHLTYYLNEC